MSDGLPDWCCASGCRGCGAFADYEQKQAGKSPPSRIARYHERKIEGKCTDCGATLQDEDGNLCVECAAAASRRAQKYHLSEKGKKKQAESQVARRARYKAAGLCVDCGGALGSSTRLCDKHLAGRRQAQLDSDARKRAGIVSIRGARTRPSPKTSDIRRYQPLDELAKKPRIRIVSALAWLDWSSATDIFEILNVDKSNNGHNPERDRFSQMISRLAKIGVLERRLARRKWPEYRLSARGRAEVAEIRGGNVRRKIQRAA